VTAGLEPEMQLTMPILLGDAIRLFEVSTMDASS
jgi:hypothetical protein